MHRWVVLSRVIGGKGWRKNAGFVLVAPVLLSPDCGVMSCCVNEVMCRLAVDVISGGEMCGSNVNGCSDVTGEVMRRSVRYAIGGSESRGDDVNEWSDVADVVGRQMVEGVLVGGEVCGGSVSGRSLLYPGLLSPDP